MQRRCLGRSITTKPLAGIRVLVTRASEKTSDFTAVLEAQGAQVTAVPFISIRPPADARGLDAAVAGAKQFAWLVFTSTAGVEAFAKRQSSQPLVLQRIAAVGRSTAEAVLRFLGRSADVVPEQFSAVGLADAMIRQVTPGDRVLVVAAEKASPVLPAKLRNAGLQVETVAAYSTVETPPGDIEQLISSCDVIVVSSPSAVRALIRGLSGGGRSKAAAAAQRKLRGRVLACIGPVTLHEAREYGLHVEIVPEVATASALADALCHYYNPTRS